MSDLPARNLLLPQQVRRTPGARDSTFGLPTDVVRQSAARLRAVALLYAFVFAMAAYVPALLLPAERIRMFSTPLFWGPGLVAIGVALLVAAVIGSARASPLTVMNLGLLFEVVGSYGIAAAEFMDPAGVPVGPPEPPSARTELPIPPALDQLVLACLAKDPAERPQTAKELSLRLAAIEAADLWTDDRARAWWAAHEPGTVSD